MHAASHRVPGAGRRGLSDTGARPRPSGRRASRCSAQRGPADDQPSTSATVGALDIPDPEAKFRRYGKDFGKGFFLYPEWLRNVPRVRVRTSASRPLDTLLEVAVLNERLKGTDPWEVRRKLEYIKMRRKNWEKIYEHITKQEAVATLEAIEEASRLVDEAASEEAQERASVGVLRDQFTMLQSQVKEAEAKLKATQQRVQENLARVEALRAEAASLELLRVASPPAAAAPPPSPSSSLSQRQPAAAPSAVRARAASASSATAATTSTTTAVAASLPASGGSLASHDAGDGLSASSPSSRRNVGLRSSLHLEDGLRHFWYPAEFSASLRPDTLVPFDLFGEPWVLFRDEAGRAACIRDECAHRACPLSLGKVSAGRVSCAYHGWQFDGEGRCTEMPSTAQCKNVAVAALPCAEKDGFVWVWPGDGVPPPQLPDFTAPPPGYQVHAEICLEVPVEHGLLMENLLDLAHAPFTHTSTFAKGWSVPDVVRFQATRLLSGHWDPYPIAMAFQPPCGVLSTIGLAQPGQIMRGVSADDCRNHLHQLHVCLPARPGHTRLLYRMSLDFMSWARHVPGIDRLWRRVAGQVLSEDLVLVQGQQARLQQGGDTWNFPVPYDKLAVRYRRWRNSVAAGDLGAAAQQLAGAGAGAEAMSSGELFALAEAGEAVAAAEAAASVAPSPSSAAAFAALQQQLELELEPSSSSSRSSSGGAN